MQVGVGGSGGLGGCCEHYSLVHATGGGRGLGWVLSLGTAGSVHVGSSPACSTFHFKHP